MRILASGKRDSLNGEEVDVTVSRGEGSTGQYTTSRISNRSLVIDATIVDSGKRVTDHVTPSSSLKKGKFIKDSKQKSKRGGVCAVRTSVSVWKCRVAKSVSHLIDTVNSNSYCCVRTERAAVGDRYQKKICDSSSVAVSDHTTNKVSEQKKVLKEKVDIRQTQTVTSEEKTLPGESFSQKISSAPKTANFNVSSDNSNKTKNNLTLSCNINDSKANNNSKLLADAGTINTKIMRGGIYHEKQVKSLCALHALNNLLQDSKAFKQEDLDKICSELDPNSWVNPHKSVFGLGNYDINVIMTALQQKKLEAIWFDKRKDPSEELNFDNIYGFILNIPSDCRLGWLALPIKRKHWVAIRNLPSVTERDAGRSNYYNLDSKFDKPESIGSTENLIEYLRGELRSPEKELFLVVTEDIGRTEVWRKNPPPPPTSNSSITTAATSSAINTNLLPVPTSSGDISLDAAAGSGNNRRTSNDSGVVDLLPDLRDINVVDLNKEDLMRRQSSGVWSDLT